MSDICTHDGDANGLFCDRDGHPLTLTPERHPTQTRRDIMTVSLFKSSITAADSLDADILFGVTPVHVTNVQRAGLGSVTLSAATVNGALLVRTVAAGKGYHVVPPSVFA